VSPLYTAEERSDIAELRDVVARWDSEYDAFGALERLRELGHRACTRAWRAKCERKGRDGMLRAAGLCTAQAKHYDKCSGQEQKRGNDSLADGLLHAAAGAHMCRQVIETELAAIRRAGGGK